MKKVTLIPYFSLAFFYHLSLPSTNSLFPVLHFSPFFILCYMRLSQFSCIWLSFFIGCFLDMCTTSTPLGFYPLCTILTTLAIYRFKVFFIEEKTFIFPIYTALYSFIYSMIFTILYTFCDPRLHISFIPFSIDMLCLPVVDSIYHLVFFSLPISCYVFVTSRKQKIYLLYIKKIFIRKLSLLRRARSQ